MQNKIVCDKVAFADIRKPTASTNTVVDRDDVAAMLAIA